MISETQKMQLETIFAGGGEMGALMRSYDWANTPLGSIETWSQSLRTAVGICLSSPIPQCVVWGQELVLLYNDGYRSLIGDSHPQALGRPIGENKSGFWPTLRPILDDVLRTGQPAYFANDLQRIDSNHALQAAYSSFSPIFDETGQVAGIFHAAMWATPNSEATTAPAPSTDPPPSSSRSAPISTDPLPSSELRPQNGKLWPQSSELQPQNGKLRPQSSELQPQHSTRQLPSCNTQPQRSKATRILLVDDNADMRDYVQRLLSQRWQVETAANGAIALNLIQQHPPDLVLTDVMMPEVDGFHLLQALRDNPHTRGIPVILLSARAGEEVTVEGLAAGADDYLIKPFSARELLARVATHLQMSQLRQEQSANRFKDEFLLMVTHELQAPLVSILGWARLLQARSFDPTTLKRALSTIEHNAAVEANLVKDLLDISSIFAGKLRLKSQLVSLVPLIQSAVSTLQAAAATKTIRLSEQLPEATELTILADGDRLKQAITSLLENAIKFTPEEGQVQIDLSLITGQSSGVEERADPAASTQQLGQKAGNQYAQITITDSGIGIRSDFLPYVFDRFTQAEVPSRHTPGGVGIGLAIARHLVELHHGTIEVSSEGEGRGAVFTIKLPLINAAHVNSDSPVWG